MKIHDLTMDENHNILACAADISDSDVKFFIGLGLNMLYQANQLLWDDTKGEWIFSNEVTEAMTKEASLENTVTRH